MNTQNRHLIALAPHVTECHFMGVNFPDQWSVSTNCRLASCMSSRIANPGAQTLVPVALDFQDSFQPAVHPKCRKAVMSAKSQLGARVLSKNSS